MKKLPALLVLLSLPASAQDVRQIHNELGVRLRHVQEAMRTHLGYLRLQNIREQLQFRERDLAAWTAETQKDRASLPPEQRAPLEETLRMVEDEIADYRKAVACIRALAPIWEKHGRREPASEEELSALAAAIAVLKTTAEKHWAGVVRRWERRLTELRTAVPRLVAAREQAERTAQAQAEADKVDAALARASDALLAAVRSLRKAGAPAAAEHEALRAAAEAAKAGDPTGYFARWIHYLDLHARWASGGDVGAAAASALQAEPVTSGVAEGSSLSFALETQAGACYAALARFERYSGSERIEGLRFRPRRAGALQEFDLWAEWRSRGGITAVGFCATEATRVRASAKLTFAGTRAPVRWAVVRWSRVSLPAPIVAALELKRGDYCDANYWKSLWTDPLPGTLAYVGAQPVLLTTRPGPFGRAAYYVTLTDPAREVRAFRPRVGKTPKTARFELVQFSGCPDDNKRGDATAAISRKIVACEARIEKRYDAILKPLDAKRNAIRRGWYSPELDAQRSRILDRMQAERDRACGPMERKAGRAFTAAANEVIDRFRAKPPAAQVDAASVDVEPAQRALGRNGEALRALLGANDPRS